MAEQKFIIMTGSTGAVGTTTVANYTAVELAKRGYLTLLIEFRTSTGQSIYMQKGLHEIHKSLYEVMTIPEKLNENTIRSAHSSKLFYLCMNFRDDSLKMQNYQAYNLSAIISEAKKYFDYIILDLPSDGREPAVATVFSSEFIHKPDHHVVVVNEKAASYKYLNDFNSILELANETRPRETTFILNSIEASHYQDYIIDYLPSLPITKPVNIVYLPYLEGLTVACNKGAIYETGINKKTRLFFKQIDKITDILEKDLKSIKADITQRDLLEEEKQGFFARLFSSSKNKESTKQESKVNKSRKKSKKSKAEKELDAVENKVRDKAAKSNKKPVVKKPKQIKRKDDEEFDLEEDFDLGENEEEEFEE